ncbi:MAG: PIN domain-containing protein [Treponema sp.]|nr:PIN domain-containing protein [Treponema sp.]
MSKKVFIDSDIVLDLLCKRDPFYEYAAQIFTLSDMKHIELFTTALVFANVYYILRKTLGIEKAKELLRKLRLLIHIVPIEEKIIDLALNSTFSDVEDALQYFTAREHGIGMLVTRNIRDYKERDILVQSPQEFLAM